MTMIDILKGILKSNMSIENYRELSNKYKLTLVYNNMKAPVVLPKSCTPGDEIRICQNVINTAMSTMYINADNLPEAKKWLDGEYWIDYSNNTGDITKMFALYKRIIKFDVDAINEIDSLPLAKEIIKLIMGKPYNDYVFNNLKNLDFSKLKEDIDLSKMFINVDVLKDIDLSKGFQE